MIPQVSRTSPCPHPPSPSGWEEWETDFTVGSGVVGQPLRIELITSGIQSGFDNVRLVDISGPPETDPPTPDPMTFASAPAATGSSSISMTATTASDASGVEYYFTATDGGNDSGWQDSTTYEDTGLSPSTLYSYTVTARDKSAAQNATGASTELSATTDAPGADIYVNDIAMSWRKRGKNYYGQATVWIVESGSGADIEGATVYGQWSGSVSGSDQGVTLADGTVMIESSGVKNGGTYTFTVTDVVKSGQTYNAALNVETFDTIVAP